MRFSKFRFLSGFDRFCNGWRENQVGGKSEGTAMLLLRGLLLWQPLVTLALGVCGSYECECVERLHTWGHAT